MLMTSKNKLLGNNAISNSKSNIIHEISQSNKVDGF